MLKREREGTPSDAAADYHHAIERSFGNPFRPSVAFVIAIVMVNAVFSICRWLERRLRHGRGRRRSIRWHEARSTTRTALDLAPTWWLRPRDGLTVFGVPATLAFLFVEGESLPVTVPSFLARGYEAEGLPTAFLARFLRASFQTCSCDRRLSSQEFLIVH